MNPLQLNIGLSAWVIQDGNYDDFWVGNDAQFALEFEAIDALTIGNTPLFLTHIHENRYAASGVVQFVDEEVWVIDFAGVLAYRDGKLPPGIRPGMTVAGEIFLHIDCFDYFERLHSRIGMPALIYQWRLDAIAMETAPYIDDPSGTYSKIRDESKLARIPRDRTDACHDDNGNADYVLTCTRLPIPPTHRFR